MSHNKNHASEHSNGADDPIDPANLGPNGVAELDGSGQVSSDPKDHKDTHKTGGTDAFANADILEATVKRLQTTTGPTTLAMGAVADGEFLKRSGTSIIGGTAGGTLSPIISPAAFTGNVNDWNPSGLSTCQAIRADPGGSNRDLTGIVAQGDGRVIYLFNISTSENIKLKNESGSSSAVNRFALKADLTLEMNESVVLMYDGTTQRWRVAGANI